MRSMTRRSACQGLLSAALPFPALAAAEAEDGFRTIEQRTGGHLGVCVVGEGGGRLDWRAEERFPLCSTFKVLSTAAILARVDAGSERLDAMLTLRDEDLLSYAPISRKAVAAGDGTGRMSLDETCAAAVEWSDNTAANLQLARLGGPEALTAWLRRIGDPLTRLDRTEPTLNTAIPGDPRDTTTPAAMRASLSAILLGSVLSPASRRRLEDWMIEGKTGFKRLRAGLPPSWTVGDKTGTGDHGSANVVAILRPPAGPPLVATVYLTGATASPEVRDAAHAEVGRLIAVHAAAGQGR